jgi:serine/threonine protein kinase
MARNSAAAIAPAPLRIPSGRTPVSSTDETIAAGMDAAPERPRFAGSKAAAPKSVGEFTLVKSIGAGAMGEVYLAEHRTTGARAALKLITNSHAADEAFIQRFNREIAILSGLDHPNIGRAIAFGVEHGHPYLAMEFINGPNLGDVLNERGALFEADVLRLAIQIARGLAYAHTEAGLIHRDIKPANILIAQQAGGDRSASLLAEGDQVKIIDFGLAKSVDAEDQRLTLTGIVMGTPSYMSPEQIRSDPHLDYHTDVYALGATMFHLLTGRIPYPSAVPAMVMVGHLNSPIPDPGALVPSLGQLTRQLVMTAMAKSAKDRFVDYRGFILACEKALKALGQGPVGTMRLLRKPMVRSGNPATPPTGSDNPAHDSGDDFAPMGNDRETRSISKRTHKPPSSGAHALGAAPSSPSTKMYASVAMNAGADPLEARPGSSAGPGRPAISEPASRDIGSQALRKACTDKFEKVKTTRRINRLRAELAMVPVSALGGTTVAGELPLTSRLSALAPMLFIGALLVLMLTLWILQGSG